jgi:hypothetical protein
MDRVPRWTGLKHFSHVTTIEYADGQAFLDILKVSYINSLLVFLIKPSNLSVLCHVLFSLCREIQCLSDVPASMHVIV